MLDEELLANRAKTLARLSGPTQVPRLRQAAHLSGSQLAWGNEIQGMQHWLWTEVSLAWMQHADAFGRELWRKLHRQATSEGRHRDEHQEHHVMLGARGVVAYFLATGQTVPSVQELLERDHQKVAEAHHYKIRSAQNLTKADYGFIWHEKDTRYRGVTHFLLMSPCLENPHQWGLVGERSVEDAREYSIDGTWLPTENKVLPYGMFRPYAGPRPGPPAFFTFCEHGEELGRRCFSCESLRLELFPSRDPVPTGAQGRLLGSKQR